MKRAGFILLSVSVRALRSTVLVRKPFCAMNPKDPLYWTSPTSTPSCCRVGRALSKLWRASSADTPTMMLPLHTCIVILQFLDSFQLQFLHSFFVIITVLVSVKNIHVISVSFSVSVQELYAVPQQVTTCMGRGHTVVATLPHCRRPSRSEDAADIRS